MTNYGLQLFSVRDITPKDLDGALAAVAKAGYTSVEFAGFFDHPASEVKAMLERYGLVASGTHTGLDQLAPDKIHDTVAYHLAIGCHDLIVPAFGDQDREESLNKTVEILNYAQPILAEAGITLGFHNHSGEFYTQPYGKVIFDELHARTNVHFELDTFWAWNAGVDPVALMRRLHAEGRLHVIHLKDGHKGVNGQRAIGKSSGLGDAPVEAVRACALELGVHMVVESEGLDPTGIEEVTRCMDFLRTLN